MGKVCVRCGYERQGDDVAPETECPQCGVIYARVETEGSGTAAARSAQARVVRAKLRHQQAQAQADEGGFVAFKTMYSPVLLRVAFIAAVVLGVAAAVLSVMGGQFLLALGCLAWILVARLSLEAIAVMFRISDDLSALRTLMSEQALDAARAAAKPSN